MVINSIDLKAHMTLVSIDSSKPVRTAGRELVGNLTTDVSQRIYVVQQNNSVAAAQCLEKATRLSPLPPCDNK